MTVPVLTDQDDDYYEHVYRQTNGCLFPGGGQNLTESSYTRSAQFFMKKSQQAAEHGNPYPIWATCLGFEQMVVLVADQCCLTRCNAKDIMSSLVPIDWKSSSFIQTSTQKAKSRASWGIQYSVIVSIRSRKARH